MNTVLVRIARRRYVAFRLNRLPPFSKRELVAALRENLTTRNGGEGLDQYRIRIIIYDGNTGLGIVRCDHRGVAALLSALRGIGEALGEDAVKTIGTSGSIKTLRRKFLPETVQ